MTLGGPRAAGAAGAPDPASFAARLRARDVSLWSADPAHQRVAAARLGWLDLPERMAGRVGDLEDFAAGLRADGFTHAVLLGMGGSSLAPEVMRRMLGVREGFLELAVLDNTSPAAVRAALEAHDPRRTFVLVSSKSGGTIEVASFERAFFERFRAARGAAAGRAFAAITDPGSPLAALAAERGYARVFENPADVGGRYSALSLFGLVPAALIGADLRALLASAAREAEETWSDPRGGAGVALGLALGAAAREGRDKLTLAFGPAWAPFGAWVEQLVAESTGKDGRGVIPMDGEPAASRRPGTDRVHAVTPDLDRAAGHALAHGGAPAWLLDLDAPGDLGAAFLRWEIATVAAAAALGVDPFDEPNVAEAKQATAAALERARAGTAPRREPALAGDGWRVTASPAATGALAGRAGPGAALDALVALAAPGDYLALLAYVHPAPAVARALAALRAAAAARAGVATTLGIGPRYLHSTGQLHKGGPASGLFLLITADEGPDLAIPGAPYTFGDLRGAQADGDFEVLAGRGRRVVRVHLGGDPVAGIAAIAGA